MLFELDVSSELNSPFDLNRVFDILGEPIPISQIYTSDLMGTDDWCDVVGWDESGPCQAFAVLSEDSGDGVILLLYGGVEGIRLRPAEGTDGWDLASASQWGEPCLMLDKDTSYRTSVT